MQQRVSAVPRDATSNRNACATTRVRAAPRALTRAVRVCWRPLTRSPFAAAIRAAPRTSPHIR